MIWKKQWFLYNNFSNGFCTFIWYLICRLRYILYWIWIIILSHECIIIIIKWYNMPIVFLEWKIFIFNFFTGIIYLLYFFTLKRSNRFLIYNLIKSANIFCIYFVLNKFLFLFAWTKKAVILYINLILLTFSEWLRWCLNIVASQAVSCLIFHHFSLIIRLPTGCYFL